ncbi:hypothetical protein [Xenorhabdus bovienii]|uniref:Uncharacterized protein n=1 Tax=Xenorhabdus bovienii str. Intermedium TaxID=1379677 RepID=A0A077QIJ1_XENBV|nr:hypothetical protein [Xenorhabdus bovienii]CDH33349.1 hypothetical protein XBI1_2620001 [Xenorhabdus bovienii str. Intermedium]
MENRLIIPCGENSVSLGVPELKDYLRLIALNIEDSMREAGAIPGKDYTFVDIYKMAMQYVSTNTVVGGETVRFQTLF